MHRFSMQFIGNLHYTTTNYQAVQENIKMKILEYIFISTKFEQILSLVSFKCSTLKSLEWWYVDSKLHVFTVLDSIYA